MPTTPFSSENSQTDSKSDSVKEKALGDCGNCGAQEVAFPHVYFCPVTEHSLSG